MKKFFSDLLSGAPDSAGTKRFTIIFGLLLFAIEVIVHLITKINVQGEILVITASLITIPMGLNTIISVKDITTRADVANTIVEQNPADKNADDAKEVIDPQKTE